MTLPLFESPPRAPIRMGPQAVVLPGFVLPFLPSILPALAAVEAAAPFRHMKTPGGHTMSAALTNCGRLGWTSDERGYRYSPRDPATDEPWPELPEAFLALARAAAGAAGFPDFTPDACLVNRYVPGARLTLHQDRNERDFSAPIVSVSLGIPAVFQFGGARRDDPVQRVRLEHGDVAIWGGVDRLRFHGVEPIGAESHPVFGMARINFTFRKAG